MSAKNNTLVRNASVLMVATIVSRVIGLLYRRPLGNIVGAVGMGSTLVTHMQLKFVLGEFRGEKIISPDGVRGGMCEGKNFLEEMSAV